VLLLLIVVVVVVVVGINGCTSGSGHSLSCNCREYSKGRGGTVNRCSTHTDRYRTDQYTALTSASRVSVTVDL